MSRALTIRNRRLPQPNRNVNEVLSDTRSDWAAASKLERIHREENRADERDQEAAGAL